jgi:hypothetical protein
MIITPFIVTNIYFVKIPKTNLYNPVEFKFHLDNAKRQVIRL